MATRKHERPQTEHERRLSYAKDCDFQAALDDTFAARWEAQGRAFDAAQAHARAARWRAMAAGYRGTVSRAAA